VANNKFTYLPYFYKKVNYMNTTLLAQVKIKPKIKAKAKKVLSFSLLIPNEITITAMKEAKTKELETYENVKDFLDVLNAKN